MNLKGKNILFIGIGFYDYEEAIISELKNKGANVFYFSSFWNNRIIKFLQYRLKFNKIISNIKSIRINNLIKKNSLNIHIVFIIKGADFKQINIDILKKRCSNAKFVLYLWDSLKCTSNASLLLNNFENIYSFDKKDVEQNTKIKFRPLFYREKLNIKNDLSFIFDLLYIGTYYPERFSLIKIFLTKLKEHHLKYKICIHISIIKYFYLRFIKNEIKKEFSKLFILRPLSYNKYIEFLSQSKVVLDIAHMM